MPLQQTSGAASYDAFGGGVPVAAKYIEDFFQTWLRTGTGASATVTTGLNGAINETMVWTKSRSAATNHKLTDNVRGATKALSSNTTAAEVTDSQGLTAFSSTGYTIGTNTDYNNSGATYVDWQWVATPKFFDVVTYTGNAAGMRQISHSLGSTPGAIIVKRTNGTTDWHVWHNSFGNNPYLLELNTTSALNTGSDAWGFPTTNMNSTSFSVDNRLNDNGATYVAYLFAHNAGGFGLSGTDNVISCGSATGSTNVTLGYEPQWLLVKKTGVGSWFLVDIMRGVTAPIGPTQLLQANLADAEFTSSNFVNVNATGFILNAHTDPYIYIAIRRGPMKVPTTGTSVFAPQAYTGDGTSSRSLDGGFVDDFFMFANRTLTQSRFVFDRLRGNNNFLETNSTGSETPYPAPFVQFNSKQTGIVTGTNPGLGDINTTGVTNIGYHFRRAPGFFDEVCYTASSSQLTLNHNLGVAPEMIITKARSNADDWYVWCQHNSSIATGACISLNSSASTASAGGGSLSSFTASSFNTFLPGINGWTVVSYLFASCPGVSKVGSYTGTGTTQVINCGFTGGARFVMIKATSTTGDWYVWDSARGIVAGNDPYLTLNTTNAEVTGTDWVDTAATGFELSNAGGNLANSNGVSYIFWAVA